MVSEKVILDDPHFTDSRLQSLYSNFNHLKENPDGLEANISAWKSLLLETKSKCASEFPDQVAFDADSLVKQYSLPSRGLTPQGLNKVIDQMVHEQALIPYSKFQQDPGLLGRVVGWVFGPRYRSGNDQNGVLNQGEKFVVASELAKWSKNLGYYLSNNSPLVKDHLISLASEELEMSKFDIECCLLNLEREKKIVVSEDVVQFVDKSQQEVNLTEEQVESIANLKYAIYKMTKYNEETELRIQKLDIRIRELVKNKHMVRAKSELKIQRALTQKLQKSSQGLENLVMLLYKIEEDSNNILVVKTLEANSKILKEMNAQVGDIQHVVEEVREEWDKVDELSEHLGALNVDDGDIEEELLQMEKEQESKEDATQEEPVPEVPTEEPVQEPEPEHVETSEDPDSALLERFQKLKLPAKEPAAEKNLESPLPI
ncbi:hypothetical protein OGAPHI_001761 [Ogataea philodendri]|uniref:Uncharacterized protein n=1 Tax=Ogataea philodendri TaxID=1378263 RepID=A0A9P8PAX9_9ASCO|nr:uncharacterized protein OGAPHI_001761 [Ogataea philodendri]KAH3668007.1 hypothetical protein OGAPHI_001761 [Ogataea philodendri]